MSDKENAINPYASSRIVAPMDSAQSLVFSFNGRIVPLEPLSLSAYFRQGLRRNVLQPLVMLLILAPFLVLCWMSYGRSMAVLFSLLVVVAQCMLVLMVARVFLLWLTFRKLPQKIEETSIQWKGYSNGFQWSSAGYEQFAVWPIANGVYALPESALLIAPSVFNRAGLNMRCERLDGSDWDGLAATVRKLIAAQAMKMVNLRGNLMSPFEFETLHFDGPKAIFHGNVTARSSAQANPALWWTNTLIVLWTVGTMMLVTLIAVTNLIFQSRFRSADLFVLTLITTVCGFVWIKSGRALLRSVIQMVIPWSILSEYELQLSEQGYESRTNASHLRGSWELFRDPQLTGKKLTAVCVLTQTRIPIFSRENLASDSDWESVCAMGMRCICASR